MLLLLRCDLDYAERLFSYVNVQDHPFEAAHRDTPFYRYTVSYKQCPSPPCSTLHRVGTPSDPFKYSPRRLLLLDEPRLVYNKSNSHQCVAE